MRAKPWRILSMVSARSAFRTAGERADLWGPYLIAASIFFSRPRWAAERWEDTTNQQQVVVRNPPRKGRTSIEDEILEKMTKEPKQLEDTVR